MIDAIRPYVGLFITIACLPILPAGVLAAIWVDQWIERNLRG